MLMFGWGFEVAASSKLWRWNLTKVCLRTCDMIKRSYSCAFGNFFWLNKFEADIYLSFWGFTLEKILKLDLDKLATWLKSSHFVENAQPLGPLCLWKCFTKMSKEKNLVLGWSHYFFLLRLTSSFWKASLSWPRSSSLNSVLNLTLLILSSNFSFSNLARSFAPPLTFLPSSELLQNSWCFSSQSFRWQSLLHQFFVRHLLHLEWDLIRLWRHQTSHLWTSFASLKQ